MKKILFLALLLVNINYLSAQSTTGYTLIADYPFQSDGVDATGNNPDATITNAPFQNGGVHLNGIYINDGTGNGSDVMTPQIDPFDINDFIISVDFKTQVNNNFFLVCGSSWRWLEFQITQQSKLAIVYGLTSGVAWTTTDFTINMDQWYTASAKYTQSNHQLEIYMDGNLVQTITLTDDFLHNNNFNFSPTNYGAGTCLNGYWRNLKLYRSTAGVHTQDLEKYLTLNYDQLNKQLNINLKDNNTKTSMQLFDITGAEILETTLKSGLNSISLNPMPAGVYIVRFMIGENVFSKKIIIS